jgi:CRISPR-associated endonuclease/helicase Cas3
MTREPIAHTKNARGTQQGLADHLQQVATLASVFADPFDSALLGRYAGLLHDIGKYNPAFQHYLLDAEQGVIRRGPDHKAAGA